ncbi:MAG: sulfonate transport system permease protein [Candidatus Methanomethylophilaceae archaeon]|nr:sulfonate transport system permease protein [Candidatus Methanomethylophilaceae archaeon]MDI3541234.1 sulfonate transport system permease protein [Candidatus Methanomethylophilaceae archaeon]
MEDEREGQRFHLRYDPDNKYHRWARTALITVISLVCLILAWWVLAIVLQSPYLPKPDRVWRAFLRLLEFGDVATGLTLWDHILSSLRRFVGGFVIAFIMAVPLGLLMGYSRLMEEFTSPIIEVLRPIAPMAWAPLFIMAMGVVLGPMMVVFVGVFFPVLSNTIFGVKKVDPYLIDAARTLGANDLQVFYKVILPSTIPYIMNGVRVGLGIGWMCIVAAEMILAFGGGIGYFILSQSNIGNWPNVFVGIAIVSILGILTTGLADRAHVIISRRMGLE